MAAEVAFEELPPERYRVVGSRPVDAAAITRLAAAIARAERPALLVGRRARFPDAGAAVRALVERFRIPVCTSLAAKGLVAEDTLLSLGILAVFGHRTSEKYLKECDLIVTIGESLEELTSVYFDPDIFARPLVQVDHDPLRIGRAFPIADAVVGDIGATLEGLAGALVEMGCRPRCDANELGAFKEAHQHFAEAVTASEAVPLKPQRVCAELARALPPDVVVVADVSTIALWAARYLPARPGSFLHFDGIGAMGGATAGAVGVKLAAGARPVVCLTGDGCFQMHGMELATAVGAGAPVIYVVMNDGHLNLVRFAQIVAYGERCISVDMANPDFAALGRAFGVQGHRVERPGELEALLPRLIAAGESAIVDVAYDGDEVPPFKPRTLLMNKQMGLPLTSTRMAGRAFRKILDER
jgi:acetolactate synthase-1/2/3 large subunit